MKNPTLVAVAATALLTLSACGNGSSSTAAQGGSGAAAGGTSASGLSIAQTSLGKVLVDGRGMTLYTLSADGQDHSTCDASCLQFWPAATPPKGDKVANVSVSTGKTATPDGTPIATVAGHPVYTFSQDQQPGDVNGEGLNEFGGTWYAVSPTGQPVTGSASSPSGDSSSTSTGRGYAY
jgi:predicted lipoprotein with Yx(FWY)xxD motif